MIKKNSKKIFRSLTKIKKSKLKNIKNKVKLGE